MTLEEGLIYIFEILNKYYGETHNDQLGQLLSDLSPSYVPEIQKMSTPDPAGWYDWVDAVRKVMHTEDVTEDALKKAKKAHHGLEELLNIDDIVLRKKLIEENGNNEQIAWDNFVEAVRQTLPDGQITKEQVKSAILILMEEYTKQGFDLTEIIDLFKTNVIKLN